MGNERGCKVWAESYIILKNGKKYYVDNTKDDIEKQILSDAKYINVEFATLISDKIKTKQIQKEEIREFHSNR